MGIETFILAAKVASAISGFMGARQQAKATVAEGKLEAERRRDVVKAEAAQQKTSFLSSGLTLAGTPQDVLESTFTTGIADVNQIISNANRQSKNIMSQARTNFLGSVATIGLEASGLFKGQTGTQQPLPTRKPVFQPLPTRKPTTGDLRI